MTSTATSLRRLIGAILIGLLASGATAQDELPEEQPEIRRYTVEVIVFSYLEDVSTGTEVFIPDEIPEPEPFGIDDLLEIDQSPLPEEIVAEEEVIDDMEDVLDEPLVEEIPELVYLAEEEFTLGNVMRQLELLDAYEPLVHIGWTQITREREETQGIDIAEMTEPPPGLSGQFTLYLSRYLHLVVDLEIDASSEAAGISAESEQDVITFGDARTGFDSYSLSVSDYDTTPTGPTIYRIDEDRIFKNGDLRYFDHPRFGAIVKVTRFEEPDEDEDAGDDLESDRQLFGDRDQ